MKDELGQSHSRIEFDGDAAEVAELQGDLSLEAGIDEAGGGVDDDGEASDGASALDAGDEVVGDLDPFHGGAEDEFAGVEDEGLAVGDLDAAGKGGGVGLAGVDAGEIAEAVDDEFIAQADVDAGRLDLELRVREGVDLEVALFKALANVAVREDHDGGLGDGKWVRGDWGQSVSSTKPGQFRI